MLNFESSKTKPIYRLNRLDLNLKILFITRDIDKYIDQ
jgi:hypothetical protein